MDDFSEKLEEEEYEEEEESFFFCFFLALYTAFNFSIDCLLKALIQSRFEFNFIEGLNVIDSKSK